MVENKEIMKEAENIQCPVCGYYCLGNGGFGCIDKPRLVELEDENHERSIKFASAPQ